MIFRWKLGSKALTLPGGACLSTLRFLRAKEGPRLPVPCSPHSQLLVCLSASSSSLPPDPSMAELIGPQEAGDYLTKVNFRSLVEYLGAEVIVNRPEDPLVFIRNILDNRYAVDAAGRCSLPSNPTRQHSSLQCNLPCAGSRRDTTAHFNRLRSLSISERSMLR